MKDQRPDPDQLLKQIQVEEREASGAKLKIFFGPYPGVGKTYAMLEAARERKRAGLDVVIGVVETHGRPETTALLKDFELLPRKEIPYKSISLKEFDLDAALLRKPDLIVVDELAHSNPPSSRHDKRWQDVEELLNAGISVYTTLNVQHWESLNDIVAQITGVKVKETVPDRFLEKAHEVELVDLPPPDLLKRLAEGKVYVGDQAIRAAENFFQVGNLIALRELALLHTADRVDAEMQEFKSRHAISKVLPVRERLLVGITAAPHSSRLVRATSRLAKSLRCDWITVYVQTPEHEKLPADQKARIIDTLRLAERLGGETAVLTGQNVPEELLKFARDRNVTKIVLGKPSRPWWKEFLFGSTVNQIARQSAEIDLYVISASHFPEDTAKPFAVGEKPERKGFLRATLLLLVCTVLGWLHLGYLDLANIVMFYLLAVVWIAYRYGRAAGIFASILSVLLFDFFLVPPYLTFAVSDTQYLITFGVMLIVAIFISTITGRLHSLAEAMRAREARLRSLYKVSQILTEIPDQNEMLQAVLQEIEEFFRVPVILLVADSSGVLQIAAGDAQKFGYVGNELQFAEWVFQHGELAGRGTNTLAGSKATYVPLRGRKKTVGVLGIRLQEEPGLIEPEQLQLIEKFAGEIGSALESKELSEAAGRAVASMEAERLKNLVLRSFSYDLAGPSQEISDAAKKISSQAQTAGAALKQAIHTLIEKSDQISRVVARLPHFLREVFPSTDEESMAPVYPKVASVASALDAERILFFPAQTTKEEILKTLVNVLDLPDPIGALESIEEREEAGGILIRPNVAIPHATVTGIEGVKASLGIQRTGDESDSKARFCLVFVSGTESIREHLAFLRDVALIFNDEILEQLAEAETSEEAFRILSRAERTSLEPVPHG